ncbi:MAG TPA: hypothetical protein VN934_01020 [Candidatus Tumulicola sp.]|nr:hypothetical protein [Candidatus Tumulicola sp.]
MQRLRRAIFTFVTVAAVAASTACTGLGANIGSGSKGSDFVQSVIIQTISGIDVLQVVVRHCLVVQSVALGAQGSGNGVSSVQGAVWTKAATPGGNILDIGLFEADCTTPYGGEIQQAIGIIGTPPVCSDSNGRLPLATCSLNPGDGTVFIKATVKGVTGFNTVKVFFS